MKNTRFLGSKVWAGQIIWHGTSYENLKNISENGIQADCFEGGYFGYGFYGANEKELAISNYAEKNDDKPSVLSFKISDEARILDMRFEDDWDFWTKNGLDKKIYNRSDRLKIIAAGCDGVYDRSVGGLCIYNEKVLIPTPDAKPEDNMKSKLYEVAIDVRSLLEGNYKHSPHWSIGKCWEASSLIEKRLKESGIDAKCICGEYKGCDPSYPDFVKQYDPLGLPENFNKNDWDGCFSHWWVESHGLIIDITADQFFPNSQNKIMNVIVTEMDDPAYHKMYVVSEEAPLDLNDMIRMNF